MHQRGRRLRVYPLSIRSPPRLRCFRGLRASGPCRVFHSSGLSGVAKALFLGRRALEDLFSQAQLRSEHWRRTGLIINLANRFLEDRYAAQAIPADKDEIEKLSLTSSGLEPATLPTFELPSVMWKKATRSFVDRLLASWPATARPFYSEVIYGGHTGIIDGIRVPRKFMTEELIDRCIIGCIISPQKQSFSKPQFLFIY